MLLQVRANCSGVGNLPRFVAVCFSPPAIVMEMSSVNLDSAQGLQQSSTSKPQGSNAAKSLYASMLRMAVQLQLLTRSAHVLQALSVATAAANCIRQISRRGSVTHVRGLGPGLPRLQQTDAGAMRLRVSAAVRHAVAETLLLQLASPTNMEAAEGLTVGRAVLVHALHAVHAMHVAHFLQQRPSQQTGLSTPAVFNTLREWVAGDLHLVLKQPVSTSSGGLALLVGYQGGNRVQVVGLASPGAAFNTSNLLSWMQCRICQLTQLLVSAGLQLGTPLFLQQSTQHWQKGRFWQPAALMHPGSLQRYSSTCKQHKPHTQHLVALQCWPPSAACA